MPPVSTSGTADAPADVVSVSSLANLAPLAAALLIMAVYRLVMLGGDPGPPGSDAGNWLAFSCQLFGEQVKAAESMYFPVMLVALRALLVFFSPLVALKLLAVLASVSVAVPLYFILRRGCSRVVSAALCVGLLMAGYQIEMLSWGGYPQLLATAFLLSALLLLDEGLASGNRRLLVISGALVALVAGTHHFTLLVLAGSVAVYAPWAAYRQRAELRVFLRRFAVWAGAAAALSLLFLPWYLQYLRIMAGEGALNSNGEQLGSLGRVFSYVYAEAPLTWMFLMVVAPLASLLPFGGAAAGRLRPLGIALVLGPALVYAATKEVRAFEPMQVGMLVCLGVVAAQVEGWLRTLRLSTLAHRVGGLTYAMAVGGLLLILVINGNLRFEGARERYAAVDENARDALDWVRQNTPADSTFLAGGRYEWVIYSWWLEGYSQRRSYGVIDPSFLAFEEEKAQAEVARRLVAPETPPDELRALLEKSGIDYLFIFKPSGGAFQNLVDKVPTYVSHQNDDFAVLRVSPGANATTRQ